jgi:hypothetical protein
LRRDLELEGTLLVLNELRLYNEALSSVIFLNCAEFWLEEFV